MLPSTLPASSATEIRFDSPGNHLVNEGLPIGNGRLGMLIPGGVERDRVAVNEDSVWSGWVNPSANNPTAAEAIPRIRKLLWQGKVLEAQEQVAATQVPNMADSAGRSLWDAYGSYQMLAFLDLEFTHQEGEVTNYTRRLDLDNATVEITYDIGRVHFRRELFVSYPDQAIVVRFTASHDGCISVAATLSRPDTAATLSVSDGNLLLSGSLGTGDGTRGLDYVARLGLKASGGSTEIEGGKLTVRKADEVTLVVSAATNYLGARAWPGKLGGNPLDTSSGHLRKAMSADWHTLLKRHVEDYRGMFNRVRLDLGGREAGSSRLPTPDRLEALGRGISDPALLELYFNFGRYLQISSSRPGSMAANLQGLWAAAVPDPETGQYQYATPWNGDYHSNINLQMNYWPVDSTGLAECFEPLNDLVHGMTGPGADTARIQHGAAGWTLHTLHNPWGYTSAGEVPSWGHFPMAGPWVVRHLWDHYTFTQDHEFLQRSWPILRGSAEFVLDWLVEDPKTGLLVSGPAGSPENRFLLPGGETAYFSMGPAMDQSIARDLFSNILAAARELGIEDTFVESIAEALPRLAPLRIGEDGRILEWAEPWEEAEPGHRHISHLYGLHPGYEINPVNTPEMARAARKTIKHRMAHGRGHTGWSRAWIINLMARLGDGEGARDNLLSLLRHSTLPNLLDTHPPFQIDGNFGATAGIAEMLLQSHRPANDGSFLVDLLPALPAAWSDGSVNGLRARGGFILDIEWRKGVPTTVKVTSLAGRALHLRWRSEHLDKPTRPGEILEWSLSVNPGAVVVDRCIDN